MKLSALPGVGPRTLEQLNRLGLETVEDLLLHVPSRYEDRTRVTPVGEVEAGQAVRFLVCVRDSRVQFGQRRSLRIDAADDSGEVALRLFHFRSEQQAQWSPGTWALCWGVVREGRWGRECVHPQMIRVPGPDRLPDLGSHLTPVYPTTSGLTQARLLKLQQAARARVHDLFPELIPEVIRPRMSVADAIVAVHTPPVDADEQLQAARDRLAFEELLAQRLAVLRGRMRSRADNAPRCPVNAQAAAALIAAFPFALTAAQNRVVAEIGAGLDSTEPMLRLVQGDVGCGKTVVAALAAAQVVAAGHQVAIMAPTEILARQHAAALAQWFAGTARVGLLAGGQKAAERKAVLRDLETGTVHIVVGTQALFQGGVSFAALGLVVIDEQHRFGVGQRLALRDKSGADAVAHQLIMTATPIPRTLAQTLYADLSISRIDAMPPGRSPVQTVSMSQHRRPDVIERLRAVCAEGQQAFWVCPALSESEHATAAEEIADLLTESLPELGVGLIHGQMKSAEKIAVMADFREQRTAVLVATTVIEVGVDVPAATIIIIDEAERLGLAQLHQLRGRVGRGSRQSYCVLLYKPPLRDTARARLRALCTTHDGFELAETDLELRGPGELLGTAQSGGQRMRFADALLDTQLLPQVVSAADVTLQEAPQHVPVLVRRWLGGRADYADV